MALEVKVVITASEQVCWAINNLSNTIASLMLTAIRQQDKAAEILEEAAQEATAQTKGFASTVTGAATEKPAPATEKPAPATQTPAPAPAAVPVATASPSPAPLPTVPTAATPTYTQNQLALAAGGLMDAGLGDALRALLATFNVPSLVQLPKEQYGAFATELRKMGAKI